MRKLKCWFTEHQWKLHWTKYHVLEGSSCLRCGKYRPA